MSITEVAEKAEASEGSVVGLCRRIGASGFQELKILIAREFVKSGAVHPGRSARDAIASRR